MDTPTGLLPLPSTSMPSSSSPPNGAHPNFKLTDCTVTVSSSTPNRNNISKSRWRTNEFKFYYLVALVSIPLMCWIPMSVSQPNHPVYPLYRRRLSDGWLFGRQVDNSDAQYRTFRSNLPILAIASLFYLLLKTLYTRLISPLIRNNNPIPIKLTLSLVWLLALHGTSALKILTLVTLNYWISTNNIVKERPKVVAIWVFNALALYANVTYSGYEFAWLSPGLAWLDEWPGVYRRWYISYNITMLRLISFGMDYHWASQNPPSPSEDPTSIPLISSTEPAPTRSSTKPLPLSTIPHPLPSYSYINYLAYILYTPLFIAGPIMSFNDWMWQHTPTPPPTPHLRPLPQSIPRYLFRFITSLLTMEIILHTMYVVAIKDSKPWEMKIDTMGRLLPLGGGYSVAQISMIGFWNLIIVWLKLLIPWRFFRLWALADGVDPPENMVRCVVNNYSTLGFWKSWHRSYNLWIVRYIYIPLSGEKRRFLNSLLVFSFVAMWHDLTFKLLAWGWLVTLFIAPELIAKAVLPPSKFGKEWWYRHICALGAVVNLFMMMIANLVGFVIGLDGMKVFVQMIFGGLEGFRFLVIACGVIFVGVQFMFEYREAEMRNGIYRRC